jgi:predicted branched-subunit amino acid permease
VPYFWGAASTNWLAWQVPSVAGIALANTIPLSWGLGFAGVLALLGVLLSLLFDRATWLATGVAATAADCRVCAAAQAQHPGGRWPPPWPPG